LNTITLVSRVNIASIFSMFYLYPWDRWGAFNCVEFN